MGNKQITLRITLISLRVLQARDQLIKVPYGTFQSKLHPRQLPIFCSQQADRIQKQEGPYTYGYFMVTLWLLFDYLIHLQGLLLLYLLNLLLVKVNIIENFGLR